MRKIPKRITRVVVDTSKTISQMGIEIPQIDYKVIADVTMRRAFTGRVTPIPTVLIHYLRSIELKLVAIIIEETIRTGECKLTNEEISLRLKCTVPTVYETKHKLNKMGLIQSERWGDRRMRLYINWDAVNNLEKLTDGEPQAIMSNIRHASKTIRIEKLTRKDVEKSYSEKVLPPDHDPREEEIYD